MQHLAKNMIPGDIELVDGLGIKVYDSNGREYLDLTSQNLNLNLGHRHPTIVNSIRKLVNSDFPYYISPRYKNKYVETLAKRLTELAPEGLNKVNLHLCNGSDANEDGLKRARKYNKDNNRRMIISFNGSYLGTSSETISASGGNFHKEECLGGSGNYIFINPIRQDSLPAGMTLEEHIDYKIKEFEHLIEKRRDIAGIIIELVPFNAGILVQPQEYVKNLERICNENDIAMIVDEAQTAFGWCGDIFTSNIYEVRPDIIALAKGMTAGFPALAPTVFKEKYDVLNGGTSENTFGAQTLGCVAALANIGYLTSSGIMKEVPEKHKRFMEHFKRMKERYSFVGNVKGLGLILGMDFVYEDGKPDMNKSVDVYFSALKKGLIINVSTTEKGRQNVISIKPPITISTTEIDDAMECLDDALREYSRK